MKLSINAQAGTAPLGLAPGQALTLRAPRSGVIRVRAGRVWATLGGSDARDLVLEPGCSLALAAGQSVVLESWSARARANADLLWEYQGASARHAWFARWVLPVFAHRQRSVGVGGCASS